jgi:nucleotide-binding universal stress UspA family protein
MPTKSTVRRPARPAKNTAKLPETRLKRILVPLDFSGKSRQALVYACALADKFEARIVLVHVIVPIPVMSAEMGVAYSDYYPRGHRREATKALHERALDLIPPHQFDRSIVSVGHAASEIIAVAERVKADMIVLTTHGRTGLRRFLMGSTAEQVIRYARCPVLSVRQN